jgi:DNA-binding GntR family transcriptional regulator
MERRGNLEDLAYKRIRSAILARTLGPGARLAEPTLARMIDMSRTPVRGALRRLAAEGFVTITPNQGAVVSTPSAKDIRDAYVTREPLEALAARLAVDSATEANLDRLRTAAEKEVQTLRDRNLSEYIEANNDFHLAVADMSGNKPLQSAIQGCLALTNVCLAFFDPFYDVQVEESRSNWEHRLLIEALQARDPSWAEAAMRVHIRSSFAYLDIAKIDRELGTR